MKNLLIKLCFQSLYVLRSSSLVVYVVAENLLQLPLV